MEGKQWHGTRPNLKMTDHQQSCRENTVLKLLWLLILRNILIVLQLLKQLLLLISYYIHLTINEIPLIDNFENVILLVYS